ncbi:VOC family protein [Luteimonas suaedae]|uniref:VOC family protein n=1 Tax=Luteimonas suaedae TaxID=2605430 RepID=UPI0011ED8D94|nr:VOC family protein [Luteimonas suaedae]
MKTANPYLNFDGNAREAFDHYRSVFGGEFAMSMCFREFGGESMGLSGDMLDRIAHIALPLGDSLLMASDVTRPGDFKIGTNTYVAVEADSGEEADRVFDGLSAGGRVEMPLQKVEWAEKFGICVDRFGVQWMVSHTGDVQFSQG